MKTLGTFTTPDPQAAAVELELAEQGDREAAKRLLDRVSMGEFNTPAVQAYMMRAADAILRELGQGRVSAAKLSHALRLDGKKTTGMTGVEIARAVIKHEQDGLSQTSAIHLVAETLGRGEPDRDFAYVKQLYNQYRKAAHGLIAMDAWYETYRDTQSE